MSTGNKTILLVEDNEAMRLTVAEVLETLDYRVLSAQDGIEALALLDKGERQIDLVLSDLMMPQMDGEELYKQLRQRYSDLKMLIMTGHPLGEGDSILEQGNAVDWIQKPFDIKAIADKLQALLDAP